RADGLEPEARDRARAREDRARRRVLREAQALSERRLLLGAHLPGDGLPDGLLHGALRARPAARLDRAVGGDARRPRAEDLASAADLRRRGRARLRPDRRPVTRAVELNDVGDVVLTDADQFTALADQQRFGLLEELRRRGPSTPAELGGADADLERLEHA